MLIRKIRRKLEVNCKKEGGDGGYYTSEQCPSSQCDILGSGLPFTSMRASMT